MLFGRVRGTAICTIKVLGTEGLKLLVEAYEAALKRQIL